MARLRHAQWTVKTPWGPSANRSRQDEWGRGGLEVGWTQRSYVEKLPPDQEGLPASWFRDVPQYAYRQDFRVDRCGAYRPPGPVRRMRGMGPAAPLGPAGLHGGDRGRHGPNHQPGSRRTGPQSQGHRAQLGSCPVVVGYRLRLPLSNSLRAGGFPGARAGTSKPQEIAVGRRGDGKRRSLVFGTERGRRGKRRPSLRSRLSRTTGGGMRSQPGRDRSAPPGRTSGDFTSGRGTMGRRNTARSAGHVGIKQETPTGPLRGRGRSLQAPWCWLHAPG